MFNFIFVSMKQITFPTRPPMIDNTTIFTIWVLKTLCRDFEDKFRSLCQFMTATEHDQLLNSLHREHELRRRVKELLRYRNNGLTTLDECVQFSHLMVARQNYKAAVSAIFFYVCSIYIFMLVAMACEKIWTHLGTCNEYVHKGPPDRW